MRISTDQQYQRLQQHIMQAQSRLADLQNQLASGKRIQRASEDAFATLGIIAFKTARGAATQHKANAKSGQYNMNAAGAALSEMDDALKKAQSLVIRAASDTTDQQARDALALEIRQLKERIQTLGNTQDHNGHYIFAGHRITTRPFEVNGTPPPSLQYQGDNGQLLLDVGTGLTLPGNLLVDQAVVAAYEALEDAQTRMEGGDISGLSGVSLQMVESAQKDIRNLRGVAGERSRQFEDALIWSQQRIDLFTAQISDREDADLAEVVTQMKVAQNTYEAALASIAMISAISLLDFIK